MFADEFGLSFRDRVATTWGAIGQTPILRREDKRRSISCFCGVTTTGKLYTVYFHGSINGERIVSALRYIRRYLTGRLILIWDGLSAHKSSVVKQYLRSDPLMEVIGLPPYSPELNPEEYCHGYVKERIRNSTPKDEQELLQLAEREFNRVRRRPKLLLSFFAHAKVPVINLSG
jgi:transposase